MTNTSNCCDCSAAPTRHFIHENALGCAECRIQENGPWGAWTEGFLSSQMAFNMGLVGVFLGIAEAARDLSVGMVTTRRRGPSGRSLAERAPIQHLIAESEIDLAAARAMLARTATTADAFSPPAPGREGVPG